MGHVCNIFFLVCTSVVKIGTVGGILYSGHKLISIHTFYIYFPVWVKFGTKDLHVIMLGLVSCLRTGSGKALSELE